MNIQINLTSSKITCSYNYSFGLYIPSVITFSQWISFVDRMSDTCLLWQHTQVELAFRDWNWNHWPVCPRAFLGLVLGFTRSTHWLQFPAPLHFSWASSSVHGRHHLVGVGLKCTWVYSAQQEKNQRLDQNKKKEFKQNKIKEVPRNCLKCALNALHRKATWTWGDCCAGDWHSQSQFHTHSQYPFSHFESHKTHMWECAVCWDYFVAGRGPKAITIIRNAP